MERESLSGNFQQDIHVLEDTLRVRQSFDVVLRRIEVGERQAANPFYRWFCQGRYYGKDTGISYELKP